MMTRNSDVGKHTRLGGRPAILGRAGWRAFVGAVRLWAVTTAADKPNILFLL